MNILHTVEFYPPSVGGSQEVVRQISERLIERGHTVTVATTGLPERSFDSLNGVHIKEFDVAGSLVRGFRGEVAKYQDYLVESNFDVVMNYAAQQWATDLVFPILDDMSSPCIMVPCGFSGLYFSEYQSYFSAMPTVLRQYDHLIFHANAYRDIDFARAHGVTHYTVIPNGALETEFDSAHIDFRSRYGIPPEIPLLLTVGTHTGSKGHRLSIEAFRMARIGRAVLVVIGNQMEGPGCVRDCWRRATWVTLSSLGQKRILLLDPPRAEVVAAFHAADLFVFGSNVEYSPLVLFEAMASRTPFVTTACGNAAEIAAWGGGGIVVPTFPLEHGNVDAHPSDMAMVIEQLLNDSAERAHIAESGYAAWKARFTWEHIAESYERLYESVLAQ